MALVFPGKTTCALCGQIVNDAKEIMAFPAFLAPSHRLHCFADAVFHIHCFANWSEGQELERLYKRYREIWESRPTNLTSLREIEEWGRQAFKEFE